MKAHFDILLFLKPRNKSNISPATWIPTPMGRNLGIAEENIGTQAIIATIAGTKAWYCTPVFGGESWLSCPRFVKRAIGST
jgi:hypothetical protein